MKFSYSLLKQLVPAIKTKEELVEKLSLYAFEAENSDGDAIDVKLPPNRFSDAAGHWGLAREIAAVYGKNFQFSIANFQLPKKLQILKNKNFKFSVKIQDKNLCSRYAGQYFDNVKVGESPKWMQKFLIACGMRPINNVVDIMNYAMLETGQPLHAFDYDKLTINNQQPITIIVRRAKKGEKIITLDSQEIELSPHNKQSSGVGLNENVLVIADDEGALAIAGIKGGKRAEVDKNTKRIIVEAANFDATGIYKNSRSFAMPDGRQGLVTDASLRFSRGLSPELVALGLNRAAELLKNECKAKPGQIIDVNYNKPSKKIIKFDIKKFVDFIGLDISARDIIAYLKRLGFKIILPRQSALSLRLSVFLVEAPPLRQDIETFEDLCEEVVRLYGYNNLKSKAPVVPLHPSGFEDQIVLKDKIGRVLISLGLNEVQNSSFISQKDAEIYQHPDLIELENPISAEYQYLRPCLAMNFLKNIESNSRFFEEFGIFELGNIFFNINTKYKKNTKIQNYKRIKEVPTLGIVLASKNQETFFRLRGIVDALFRKIGAGNLSLIPAGEDGWVKTAAMGYLDLNNSLKIELENGLVIGYLGKLKSLNELKGWHLSVFEIDLAKMIEYVEEEYEYEPISKYPSITRDVSIWVTKEARVGDIMRIIQQNDLKFIEDVDLIDEYESDSKRSLAFRIVFQAKNKTLTDMEVNGMMEKIVAELKNKFKAEVR